MKIIGLTGGIGSGKTTVSNILKEWGIIILDADMIAREIVEPGNTALEEIKKEFGLSIIDKYGNLDRKKLGQIVFCNKSNMEKLNNIMHKKIIDEIQDRIEKIKDKKMVVIDAALLIETGVYKIVDEIWVVYISRRQQIERLKIRDNLSEDEINKRIDSQMPIDEKKKYADVVIDNSKDINYLMDQIKKNVDI